MTPWTPSEQLPNGLFRTQADALRYKTPDPQFDAQSEGFIAALAASLRDRRLLLLVGAGISAPSPSSLPLAASLCQTLWESLNARVDVIPKSSQPDPWVAFRPESFFSLVHLGLGSSLFPFFDGLAAGAPNAYHAFIASLGVHGYISEVWTTNFDPLIEHACVDLGLSCEMVWPASFRHLPHSSTGRFRICKLHGTVHDLAGAPTHETLAFTSRHVDQPFDAAFSRYLLNLLLERDLLVMGYSGRDPFDIEPILRSESDRTIFWIEHHIPVSVKSLAPRETWAPDDALKRLMSTRPNIRAISASTQDLLSDIAKILDVSAQAVARPCDQPPRTFQDISRAWSSTLHPSRVALAIGYVYWSYHASNGTTTEEAESVLEHVRRVAISERDASVESESLRLLAMLKEKSGDSPQAEALYLRAIAIARNGDLTRELAMALEDYGFFLNSRQ